MGLAQIHVNAVAGTASLTNQGREATGVDGDAHPCGVGDVPAVLLLPTDQLLGLGHAANGDGLPLLAIETKDAVGFREHLPTLQIAQAAAALLPLADVGPIEGA